MIADIGEEQGTRTAAELAGEGDVAFVKTDIADPESAIKSSRPSRDSRIPRGRLPTAIRSTTCPASGSITTTEPPVSSETYSNGPEGSAGVAGGAGAGVVAPADEGGGSFDPPQPLMTAATHTTPRAENLSRFRIAASASLDGRHIKRRWLRVPC